MLTFTLLSIAGALAVVVANRAAGGARFAVFAAVLLTVHVPASVGVYALMPSAWPLWAVAQAATLLYFGAYTRPGLRPVPFRLLVSWPASWFYAGTFLAVPWSVLGAVGFDPWLPWLPFALATAGLFQSVVARKDVVPVHLDGVDAGALAPHTPQQVHDSRPIRVVQITDPHLGPFMSVERLRGICQRAVDAAPDLILLTGDYLTVESNHDVDALTAAFAPLAAYRGRVYAVRGNHDLEAPQTVASAMAAHGVRLLIDEAEVVNTEAGPVQLVGVDFQWRDREAHLDAVCRAWPRLPGHTRIVLLHDPGAFRHVPAGEADLVLAGHTHGGQIGLWSLGSSWTALRSLAKGFPDHGLWARGTDRLYVHRGTGHYGFPIRLGVPAEESVLEVHRAPALG